MLSNEKELFKEQLQLLENSEKVLSYSYQMCKEIGLKDQYLLEELDKFEALTSRFARTSDIIIQKVFRLIDIIELEDSGSVIDRINRAEKRGLITSAEIFKNIRRLRNGIAHEYLPSAIEEIFKEVLKLTPYLIDCIRNIKAYEVKY